MGKTGGASVPSHPAASHLRVPKEYLKGRVTWAVCRQRGFFQQTQEGVYKWPIHAGSWGVSSRRRLGSGPTLNRSLSTRCWYLFCTTRVVSNLLWFTHSLTCSLEQMFSWQLKSLIFTDMDDIFWCKADFAEPAEHRCYWGCLRGRFERVSALNVRTLCSAQCWIQMMSTTKRHRVKYCFTHRFQTSDRFEKQYHLIQAHSFNLRLKCCGGCDSC